MKYYCHGCDSEVPYLAEVSDPSDWNFTQPCCPYCGSTQVQQSGEDDSQVAVQEVQEPELLD